MGRENPDLLSFDARSNQVKTELAESRQKGASGIDTCVQESPFITHVRDYQASSEAARSQAMPAAWTVNNTEVRDTAPPGSKSNLAMILNDDRGEPLLTTAHTAINAFYQQLDDLPEGSNPGGFDFTKDVCHWSLDTKIRNGFTPESLENASFRFDSDSGWDISQMPEQIRLNAPFIIVDPAGRSTRVDWGIDFTRNGAKVVPSCDSALPIATDVARDWGERGQRANRGTRQMGE